MTVGSKRYCVNKKLQMQSKPLCGVLELSSDAEGLAFYVFGMTATFTVFQGVFENFCILVEQWDSGVHE